MLSVSARIQSAEFNWKSAVSGNASTPENWLPSGPPGITDTAIFNLGSTGYTVGAFSGQLGQLKVGNDTLTINGSSLSIANPTLPAVQLGSQTGDVADLTLTNHMNLNSNKIWIGETANTRAKLTIDGTAQVSTALNLPTNLPTEVVVGGAGRGTLAIKSGNLEDVGTIIVARDSNSRGTVTIDSEHARLQELGAGLTVGQGGIGSLALTNGGHADVAGALMMGQETGSQGTITIDGLDSIFTSPGFGNYQMTSTTVGGSGQGTFSIVNGGESVLAGPLVVGQNEGSVGTVTIDGTDSKLSAQGFGMPPQLSLAVGAAGQGSMSLIGGATASLGGPIIVGSEAGSVGTLDVNGSLLQSANVGTQNVDQLVVGASGVGTLTVSNAGVVDLVNASVMVGKNAESSGTINVTGSSSEMTVKSIDVGSAGTGLLSISDGGKVSVWAGGSVQNHSNGKISIQGGTIAAATEAGTVVDNAGILINNGEILCDVTNLAGGVLSGSGTISGTLTQTGGTISPGNSPGVLTVGTLDLQGGAFQFEINSASGAAGGPSGWDLLNDLGPAVLSGTTNLNLVSLTSLNEAGNVADFDPLHNYQWTFLTASGGITGFNPANFTIDTTDFSNPFGGHFFVSQVGNALALNYNVPEPSSIVQVAVGIATVLAVKFGRRRSHRS